MFKVNNKDTRTRRQWRHSGVFIINLEHSALVVLFLTCYSPQRTLLNPELKIFDYGRSGTSASIDLKFEIYNLRYAI